MNNTLKWTLLAALTATPTLSFSDYRFYYQLNSGVPSKNSEDTGKWRPAPSIYGDWMNKVSSLDCKTWLPSSFDKTESVTFRQLSSDCTVEQSRTVQHQEINDKTQEYRNAGGLLEETRSVENQTAERDYTVFFSEWVKSEHPSACSNWSPSASAVPTGREFDQTSNDCQQPQIRSRSESYADPASGQIVSLVPTQEHRIAHDQTETKKSLGERYTHTMKVGSYDYLQSKYAGYFSSSYINSFAPVPVVSASVTPDTIGGYTIDAFVHNFGVKGYSLRLLPVQSTKPFTPVVTINGISCEFNVLDIYLSYNGACNFMLDEYVGKTIKIDVQTK